MLKIELRNAEGKVETFTEDFVSARKLRSVIQFGMKMEKESLLKRREVLVNFQVSEVLLRLGIISKKIIRHILLWNIWMELL